MSTTSPPSPTLTAFVTCGDLRGAYTNVHAPVCSGQYNTCTFSNSLQGCCDSHGSCQFYTTCNGGYAAQTCGGSSCLSCPTAAPYCVKYNFWDSTSQTGYDGYSCAAFNAQQTIFGVATSIGASAQSTTSASVSSSTSLSSSSRLTATSTTSSALSTGQLVANPDHESHTKVIVGSVVGGALGLALIAGAAWYFLRSMRRRSDLDSDTILEVQQLRNYGHGTTMSPLLHTEPDAT